MKKILFFLVLLIRFNSANSQVKNSENGYIVTQKGTMRLLIVYAEIDYTGSGITDPFAINSSWQAGQLPANAGIEFDADLPMGGPTMGTITDYYYQASCGNYILLGDYYNNVVTLPYNVNSNGSADVISYLNNHNFRTGHNKTLADFDNWKFYDNSLTNPKWETGLLKVNTSNQLIDGIYIVWRNNKTFNPAGNCNGGGGLVMSGMYTNTLHSMTGIEAISPVEVKLY